MTYLCPECSHEMTICDDGFWYCNNKKCYVVRIELTVEVEK